jgi:hypothetical protein
MSWKPIDLAPRDGSRIVVAFRSPVDGDVSASVSWWGQTGWERETVTGDEVEAGGDVAFAWTELPEDAHLIN